MQKRLNIRRSLSSVQVVGFDVSADNLRSFAASGGIAAESPLAVAAQAKTVVTMLPAGAHVLEAHRPRPL